MAFQSSNSSFAGYKGHAKAFVPKDAPSARSKKTDADNKKGRDTVLLAQQYLLPQPKLVVLRRGDKSRTPLVIEVDPQKINPRFEEKNKSASHSASVVDARMPKVIQVGDQFVGENLRKTESVQTIDWEGQKVSAPVYYVNRIRTGHLSPEKLIDGLITAEGAAEFIPEGRRDPNQKTPKNLEGEIRFAAVWETRAYPLDVDNGAIPALEKIDAAFEKLSAGLRVPRPGVQFRVVSLNKFDANGNPFIVELSPIFDWIRGERDEEGNMLTANRPINGDDIATIGVEFIQYVSEKYPAPTHLVRPEMCLFFKYHGSQDKHNNIEYEMSKKAMLCFHKNHLDPEALDGSSEQTGHNFGIAGILSLIDDKYDARTKTTEERFMFREIYTNGPCAPIHEMIQTQPKTVLVDGKEVEKAVRPVLQEALKLRRFFHSKEGEEMVGAGVAHNANPMLGAAGNAAAMGYSQVSSSEADIFESEVVPTPAPSVPLGTNANLALPPELDAWAQENEGFQW